MYDFDLLYPSAEKRRQGRRGVRVGEKLVQDLQLEELLGNGVLGKTEYEALCEEIKYLPWDREVIVFRQRILQDLIDNPAFIRNCMDFGSRLKDNVPRKRVNVWESSEPVHKVLQEHINLLKENYLVICSADLKGVFRSDVLSRMADFLDGKEHKARLQEVIGLLEEVLDAGALEYQAEYRFGQALDTVLIQRLFQENSYICKEKGVLRRKVVDEDYLISAEGNLVLRNNLNEIYAKTLVKLCDLASRINSALVGAFKQIRRELAYYQAGIRLLSLYRRMDIPACIPEIEVRQIACMEYLELYPVRLLAKSSGKAGSGKSLDIQGNDYRNELGKIGIVTGTNSGGKTTFLQALGTAQVFLQLGFFVPARFCRASAAPYIGSLFAGMEDIHTVHGKLEQELVEIRKTAGRLKEGSLILMNEILSTTSEEEGTQIMAEVLGAFSETHSNLLFATHLSRLAVLAQEGTLGLAKGEKAVNYVAGVEKGGDGDLQRTYRIKPGTPLKNIYEKEFLDRFQQYLTVGGKLWPTAGAGGNHPGAEG